MTSEKSPAVPLRLAVLISGGGSTMLNLQSLIEQGSLSAEIRLVIASRQCAGVDRAKGAGLTTEVLSPKSFSSNAHFSEAVFQAVREVQAELVVLAGFLSKISIPADFTNRVMNIHPSLIPAFCGQGMFGHHVHAGVIARGCKVSGCTVHFCDNEYDHGPIILQRTVQVAASDTADSLAERVQAAECLAYPEAIQLFAENRLRIQNGIVEILDS